MKTLSISQDATLTPSLVPEASIIDNRRPSSSALSEISSAEMHEKQRKIGLRAIDCMFCGCVISCLMVFDSLFNCVVVEYSFLISLV